MPIQYQPAEPLAPGVSALAGAAQQWSRDEPSIVAQQGHLAQAYQGAMQGQQHSLDFISRIMQEQAQRTQQTQNLILQHQLGQQDQQQRVQMQAWLQQQDLSAQEQTRLSRLQSALGSVMNDENLSPQEKMDYATKLRTGIDPLQQRMEASRQRQMDQQYKQAQDQQKRQTELLNMTGEARAARFAGQMVQVPGADGQPSGFVAVPDPVRGTWSFQQDHGYIERIRSQHEERLAAVQAQLDAATRRAEALETAAETRAAAVGQQRQTDIQADKPWHDSFRHHMDAVTRERGAGQQNTAERRSFEDQLALTRQRMEAEGFAPTIEEHRERQGRVPAPPTEPAPDFQEGVQRFAGITQHLGMSPSTNNAPLRLAQEAQAIYQRYLGHVEAMPRSVRAKYESLQRQVHNFLTTPPVPSQSVVPGGQ